MSKITIGKQEFEVEETLVDQCELLFYEDNPRVYSALRADGASPTQEAIEAKMISMDHVKQLRLSIEQNGGLIDPLMVVKRNGDFVVLEGNSRLAAYRLLAAKDPFKWRQVRVCVLPERITEGDIFTLLGQYHLIGRKDWSVFEQAAYLYRQKETSHIDNEILAKNVGLTVGKVNAYIEVYQFMLEHDDLRPDRWSYYEEYLKNRGIKKYRATSPKIDDTFVSQVKTGQIKQAIDVRNVLGRVAKSGDKVAKRVMQDVIDGKTDIYSGLDKYKATGKASDGYQRVKKFHDLVTDVDFQKALLFEATSNPSIAFELKKIQKAVEKMLKDIEKSK